MPNNDLGSAIRIEVTQGRRRNVGRAWLRLPEFQSSRPSRSEIAATVAALSPGAHQDRLQAVVKQAIAGLSELATGPVQYAVQQGESPPTLEAAHGREVMYWLGQVAAPKRSLARKCVQVASRNERNAPWPGRRPVVVFFE